MENLVWAVLLWVVVFVLIPMERIKELLPVAAISFIWMFILELIFVTLGYYRYTKWIVIIAGVPLFHLVGGAAGGMLLLNWIGKNPLSKVFSVSLFSMLLSASEYVIVHFGAFKHLHDFNYLISFIFNIAGLSFLVWFSIAIVGEDKIYSGNKTRFLKKDV